MSDRIQSFFDRLSQIDGPILTDISGGERCTITGSDLTLVLDRIAHQLSDEGAGMSDRVIAIFDNTLESSLVLLAAMRHGVTLCLQPAGATDDVLARLKAELDAKVIVNASRQPHKGAVEVSLAALEGFSRQPPGDVKTGTPFTVTFTSGSTGVPKGVVHSAESFLACADAFNTQSGIGPQDRFLNVMPMYYMAGIFNGIIAPLVAGAPVVIADAFGTATGMRFWPLIATEEITALWLSPTMLSLVARLDRTDKAVPPSVRRLFVGTGAMAAADAESFKATYGLPPLQSYGLSELLYISVDDTEHPNLGTVGLPISGVTLDCAADSPLTISTPYGFLGYLVNGALQPHSGSFATSDLAHLSADGVLSILGRADDIILRGGVNVNPVDVETALSDLLHGRRFCVAGPKDATLGQSVMLVVEGSALNASVFAEARQIVRDMPGRVQLDGTSQVAALPVGPTGKIRRAALRTMLDEAQPS